MPWTGTESGSANLRCEERVVREDEERSAVLSAEDKLQWALGDVDLRNLPAFWRVDKDLAVGHIHVPRGIYGDAFAAAWREGLQIAQRAIGIYLCAVGDVFGFVAHIYVIAGRSTDETVGIEIVREPPTGVVRWPLLEDTGGRQKYASIR